MYIAYMAYILFFFSEIWLNWSCIYERRSRCFVSFIFFLAALQQRRFGKFLKFHCLQRIDRLCCSSCFSSLL